MDEERYIQEIHPIDTITSREKYWAFFDLDETLLMGKSMLDLFKFFCETCNKADKYHEFINNITRHIEAGCAREFLNNYYYKEFRGFSFDIIHNICDMWFQEKIRTPHFFMEKILHKLKDHQKLGAICVIVSGSFQEAIRPIAEHLGIHAVIANSLQIEANFCTGNLNGLQIIGEGKSKAIKKIVRRTCVPLKSAFAYADHISDLPMLELVGNPVVVGTSPELRKIAKDRGWSIIM